MYFLFGIHTLCKSHSYKQFGTVLVPHTQLLRLRGKMLTYFNISIVLKAQDKFGNCQRPVFSLRCISTYMHEKKNVKILTQLVVEVACLTSCVLPDGLNLRPQLTCQIQFKCLSAKLPLSQKRRQIGGGCFSQCFILPTALQCLVSFYANNYFE